VSTQFEPERAILIGIEGGSRNQAWKLADSLDELAQLAEGSGAVVVDRFTQHAKRETTYYLGRGKLDEIKGLKDKIGFEVAICDDELTPGQQRKLESILQVKVIDRSALILDTFAQHAHTKEGYLQVELAQHQYLLPRLTGQWSHLERLGGGIGTRGPGETQLETDRRLMRQRIRHLQSELDGVRRHRARHRDRRKGTGIPIVSLVGYTNAGKSTLFNALVGDQVVSVEDRPFSTLDPTTRRINLPSGQNILLTDTVGFIQKLPPTVVAAFRATLEELTEADMLLHVVDSSHKNSEQQIQEVNETLVELGLAYRNRIVVYNKIDLPNQNRIESDNTDGSGSETDLTNRVNISALKGSGLADLRKQIDEMIRT